MNEKQIAEFLLKAIKNSWIYKDVKVTFPLPKMGQMKHKYGNWTIIDQWVGDEPFQGLEVIWYKNKPVWSRTYRGGYTGNKKKYPQFMNFLKAALRKAPKDMPTRGPNNFLSKKFPHWRYKNNWKGSPKEFNGGEKVYFIGKEVYRTKYQGGLVNNDITNI